MVSSLRILGFLAALVLGPPGHAADLPEGVNERVEFFAVCAGRMRALEVHLSAVRDARAGVTRAAAADFEMFLEALLPDAEAAGLPEAMARRWRTRGWIEIARLLAEDQYGSDERRAERARTRLRLSAGTCFDIVLPGDAGT